MSDTTKLLVITAIVRVPSDTSPYIDVRGIETKYDYLTDIEAYDVVAVVGHDPESIHVEWLI